MGSRAAGNRCRSLRRHPRGPRASDSIRDPHFAKLDRDKYDTRRSGVLGRTSFATHEDDDVMVQAELSEPAYSYLIAFRPDGTDGSATRG